MYKRQGVINSTVSLSNGDDTQIYPLAVAAPPAEPAPERDLPGFPQVPPTAYGKFIGGFGLDSEYGGECSPGYEHSAAQVIVIGTRGQAKATLLGWADPDSRRNCRILVHYSIAASAPNPSPNFVQVQLVITEKGASN